jgi:hypothetical protein
MSAKQEVAPNEIEAKLVEIWDELQGTNKMRACLFNLIVFTKKNTRLDYLREISQKLIERFPTRIIFVTIDEDGPADLLTTTVSVMSAKVGDNEIVCDLITIDVGQDNMKMTPFLAVPHLLPDLPVYLHWAANPSAHDPITEALGKYATRIIYDSECSENLGVFAQSVLKRKELLGNDLADLNWRRIEGWRHMITDTFITPEREPYLYEIKEIHVSYNTSESQDFTHTRIQALYLQGWIANQLGWEIHTMDVDEETTCIGYDYKGHPTSAFLHPGTLNDIGPGRIISLTIVTDKEEKFIFERDQENPNLVAVELTTPDHCEMPSEFLLDKYACGLSLAKEISHKGTSNHLESLLQMFSSHNDKALDT